MHTARVVLRMLPPSCVKRSLKELCPSLVCLMWGEQVLFGTERPEHDDGKQSQLTGPWGCIEVSNDHDEARRSPKDRRGEGGVRQNVMS